MDFTYYGVKVGSIKEQVLDFNNLFNDENEIAMSLEEINHNEYDKEELEVYDIILAGVK